MTPPQTATPSLRRRGKLQNGIRLNAWDCADFAEDRTAEGERAGLIERDRRDLRRPLEVGTAFEENTSPRSSGYRGQNRRRN